MAIMTTSQMLTGIKNWVLGKIANITALIPLQASTSNQLADKAFVSSSVATATATFRGTYNVVTDLSLAYNATHSQIESALATKMTALSITPDNNDYAFVQIPTADATPTEIARIEKYKYNGSAWAFEYELNNSGFTAAQWAAINSGATLELMGKLSALPTNSELATLLNGKAAKAQNPTSGHLAALDSNGSLTDSGISIDDNGAYDVTAHNSGATFASLSALLSDANLSTLIPADVRKGGMSIKYVQTSDNKYVQYRFLLSGSFTDVQFANPDYWQGGIDVCLDNNIVDKINEKEIINSSFFTLGNIRTNGNIDNVKTNVYSSLARVQSGIYTSSKKSSSAEYLLCIALYDSNKSFISRGEYANVGTDIEIPNTAYYIRICILKKVDGTNTDFNSLDEINGLDIRFYSKNNIVDNVSALNTAVDALQEQTRELDKIPTLLSDKLVGGDAASTNAMRGCLDFSLSERIIYTNKKNVVAKFKAVPGKHYILYFDNTNWIQDSSYSGIQIGCYAKYSNDSGETTIFFKNKGELTNKTRFYVSAEHGSIDYIRLSLVGDIEDTVFYYDMYLDEETETGTDVFDFAIKDENNNYAALFEGGNIRTKNFDSKDLQALTPFLTKYKNKVISILGDSISTFGVPRASNEEGTYCYSYYPYTTCRYSQLGGRDDPSDMSFKIDINDTWWMRVINYLGAYLGMNESSAGTTITDAVNTTGYLPMSTQQRIDHLGKRGTPDLILIFGGTNDIGRDDLHVPIGTFDPTIPSDLSTLTNHTLADATKAMVLRVMKTYPDSEVVALLPTYTKNYYNPQELDEGIEMLKKVYDFFGVKYIDTRIAGISIYNNDAYFHDGTHPNEAGMKKIADCVYKGLMFK